MRQVEVEARVGRDEPDFGTGPDLRRSCVRPPTPAAAFDAAQAGKAECRRLGELVGEPQFELPALPHFKERARDRASVGISGGRRGRRRLELKRRRRGFETNQSHPAGGQRIRPSR